MIKSYRKNTSVNYFNGIPKPIHHPKRKAEKRISTTEKNEIANRKRLLLNMT